MDLQLDKLAADQGGKDRSGVRASDLELWKKWKESNEHPDHLRPLLNNFRGMIRQQANRWTSTSELPPAAIHAEYNKQFVSALRTYDPEKGAALGTWVHGSLRKAQRWVSSHQNAARIAEKPFYKVGDYEAAAKQLDDEFGREPTTLEIAERLKWSEREVNNVAKRIRRTNIASAWENDPTEILPSRESEVLRLVKYELSPEELLVYEHTTGEAGKPKLRPSEIARQLGYSPSKVTRLRQAIEQKMRRYL